MMGIRIECCGSNIVEAEWVRCTDDFGFKNFFVSHAEFKAACCRDLGLVDPDGSEGLEDTVDDMAIWQIDYIREAYEALRSKLTGRSKAADVLAAASRRLA